MKILITGGAGFIGANLIHFLMEETDHSIVNVDKLTYAGNLNSLSRFDGNTRLAFERVDIANAEQVKHLFKTHQPDWVMHLAAESHVDRSIDNPDEFIQTNIVGTFNLLHAAKEYFETLDDNKAKKFRFHHVSTDEVYGSLDFQESGFTEITPYAPHSPYSASKAASDHLVRSWHDTYGLPVLITNCSNNYGPFQFPEKLVPVVILKAISGEPIPIYGKGENIRDWLYVTDHAKALYTVITRGNLGQTYNIGGNNERQNIDLVKLICEILDELLPVAENKRLSESKRTNLRSYSDLIEFVRDRPGHDLRYAIDATKISTELGWQPEEDFSSGFRKTVRWYLENESWWENILSGDYRLERLGVSSTHHNEIKENK